MTNSFFDKQTKLIEWIFFIALICLYLFPVWSNAHFLTLDGPCHVYNSKILLDYIVSNNVDFYQAYYTLNTTTEPNWFTHVSFALLLSFLPVFLAEKLFLTAYIVLYAFSFRHLIKQIHRKNTFLVFLVFPFIFHYTFQAGFYNYSYSLVFFFICTAYWIKHASHFTFKKAFVLSLLLTLLYFMHLVGLSITLLAIFLLYVAEFIKKRYFSIQSEQYGIKTFLYNGIKLFLASLPSLLLYANYLSRKALDIRPGNKSFKHLYHDFIEIKSLVLFSNVEETIAICLSILFGFILIYIIYQRVRENRLTHFDVFLVLLAIMLFVYFKAPNRITGSSVISLRLQFVPYLIFIVWFASTRFSSQARRIITIMSMSLAILFMLIRLPYYKTLSEATKEYISVGEYIDDTSTVLPLSFSHNGKTIEGKTITNRAWLFVHAADYIGADKSLILFGNYEVNVGYFPFIWKDEKNPFVHLSTHEGIEYAPPSVGIEQYIEKTEGSVDYVVTWCLDDEYINHPYTIHLLDELRANYQLIYISEHKRAKLYKRIS